MHLKETVLLTEDAETSGAFHAHDNPRRWGYPDLSARGLRRREWPRHNIEFSVLLCPRAFLEWAIS